MTIEEARAFLAERGQEQILRFYDELSASERQSLLAQIEAIDWSILKNMDAPQDLSGAGNVIEPISGLDLKAIERQKAEFYAVGKDAIQKGKVACVLLAGGQGTRLGVDGPKGKYDIGITKPVYIFERLIRNLQEVTEGVGSVVPLYIMTSEKNHDETVAFFAEHDYFGYPKAAIRFFRQEMAPAVDFNGKVLLEEKGRIALSPNGNGGWFRSMQRAGFTEEFLRSGVEWLNVFAVDNVLQRMADPVFVGATVLSGADSGAKAVVKVDPHEKVGVLCYENGRPSIIEYYELTEEMATAKDENGAYSYRYGVILNYLFALSRLSETAEKEMPLHIVRKKVPYVDETGNFIKPEKENAYKFETLVLDMIRLMGDCLPFEVERNREFAPIKNKTGVDSVESARKLLQENGVEL